MVASAMMREVLVSTDLVDVEHRSDFWREATKPFFETTPVSDDQVVPLKGSICSRPLGSILMGLVAFNRQQYHRDRRAIVESGLDSYMLQAVVAGTLRGDFNGVDVCAEPGDISIMDLGQMLRGQVDAGSRITFVVPRGPIEKATGSRNLHGTVLKGRWPMARVLIAYLEGLHAVGAQLSVAQAAVVEDSLIALLASALNGEIPDASPGYPPLEAALRQRILTFIEQNPGQRDLSLEFLVKRFNVSRSHLYRAFASDGGVATVLRDRRLDMAFGHGLPGTFPAGRIFVSDR